MKFVMFRVFFMLFATVSCEECIKPEDRLQRVYFGWPFQISCIEALQDGDYDYNEPVYSESSNISCLIIEVAAEKVLLNSTFTGSITDFSFDWDGENPVSYEMEDIKKETTTDYKVYVHKAPLCWEYKVKLQPLELRTETCEENLARFGVFDIKKDVGAIHEGRCDVPNPEVVPGKLIIQFKPNPGPNDDKVYWLFNCQEKLPNNAEMRLGAERFPTTLHFRNISYEKNPGNYTCVIEHNNMKRYRLHQRICVQPTSTKQLSIKCNSQTAHIGDDVEIECTVDAGLGSKSGIHFIGQFNKLNSTDQIDLKKGNEACDASTSVVEVEDDKRISCQLHKNKIETTTCFYKPPTEKELKVLRTSLRMIYRIRNVTKSDFGNYIATIKRFREKEDALFSLKLNHDPKLSKSQKVLVICLVTFAGILLLCLLQWLACGIELRWIWFKTFSSEEKESKRYSAYLAYHYSDDMRTTSPALFKEFIKHLNTSLKTIGGDIFDKSRVPASQQFTAGCISDGLDESHRVVIIATPEYINDHWGVYETYEAWKSAIENESAIIFVTFPETKRAIESLSNERRTTLKKALKRHKTIKWDGSLPFTRRMQMQLELFMPKLPKKTDLKLPSSERKKRVSSEPHTYAEVYFEDSNGNLCGEDAI